MYQSKSKCWYSNNCLHFTERTVPLPWIQLGDMKLANLSPKARGKA